MMILLAKGRSRGFTLTEVLVVMGLVAVLASLILPVATKARKAARATVCTSNLRQMGSAWLMYIGDSRGRLPDYVGFRNGRMPSANDHWHGYWPGILDKYEVPQDTQFCPEAAEPLPYSQHNKGFGSVAHAWSGRHMTNGSVFHFNHSTYREGSYGYNKYLVAAANNLGYAGSDTHLTAFKPVSEVPVFLDAVAPDFEPTNVGSAAPVAPPPHLSWEDYPADVPDHWRFLIARHGRGINVCFADGSTRWIPLEETYLMTWKANWTKYRLTLPAR